MMKFTKEEIKVHLGYSKWVYIIAIVVCVMLWNIVYASTEPEPNGETNLTVISTLVMDSEVASQWSDGILESLPEDQESCFITSIANYSNEDESTSELLFARLAAQEGDLWLTSQDIYQYYAYQGAWMPLDTVIDEETGETILDRLHIPEKVDVTYAECDLYVDGLDTDETERHIAGIPMDTMEGLFDLGTSPIDKVLCIPVYCDNLEGAIGAINWILDHQQEATNG